MNALRFDDYGGVEVLEVRDVPRPDPGRSNPSERTMRARLVRDFLPLTFPSGQGSHLAGAVEEVGPSVGKIVLIP